MPVPVGGGKSHSFGDIMIASAYGNDTITFYLQSLLVYVWKTAELTHLKPACLIVRAVHRRRAEVARFWAITSIDSACHRDRIRWQQTILPTPARTK